MGIKSAPCVCVIQDPPNNSLLGGVRLREASTLRFEGRIPTFLKRCGGDYAGEGNVPQSVVLCDATIVSADYLAVV